MAYILVVDDAYIMRQGTVMTLRMLGYDTDEAEDGLSALSKVKNSLYDAILMDYNMAGMLGTECAREIRKLEHSTGARRTPIIGMTGSTEMDIRETCLQSGMDDYLDKSSSSAELNDVLRKWVGKFTSPQQWSLHTDLRSMPFT